MDLTDKSTKVRQGEELDLKVVEHFLRDSIPGLSGELVVEQFPSGFSNLTYLIKVGGTDLVLRRPPFGRKAKTAHDMGREYRILTALHPVFPCCPKPLIYTEDESVMGCPFYVMERIPGIILRKKLPQGLELSPAQMRALCENLLDVHYKLHSIDYKAYGLIVNRVKLVVYIQQVLAQSAHLGRAQFEPLGELLSQDDTGDALHYIEGAAHDRFILRIDQGLWATGEYGMQCGENPVFPAHVMGGLGLASERRPPEHEVRPADLDEVGKV